MIKPFRCSAVLPASALVLVAACSSAPSAVPDPNAVVLGAWHYSRASAAREEPSLSASLYVTIVVDSVDAEQFRGRVAIWFVGDVGLRPDAFGPVTGTLGSAGAVTMRIPLAPPGVAAITIVGTLAADTLTVGESLLGTSPGPFQHGECFHRSPA